MRQAVFMGRADIRIEEVPVPTPKARHVLVRVEGCGICGTDRAFFVGDRPVAEPLQPGQERQSRPEGELLGGQLVTPPIVLGHEFTGVVVECGPEVTAFKVGDRVAVDPNVVCGMCTFCRRGLVNLCQHLEPLGITQPGGYAEYACVPETNAYGISEAVSFDAAALVEPLACSIRGIQRANVQLGDVVVVLGAGPLGLLLGQLARLRGAGCTMITSSSADRRALAERLGIEVALDGSDQGSLRQAVMAQTQGLGADVVIEATGKTAVAQQSLNLVRTGGNVVLFGCCREDDRIEVPPLWTQEHEISILGSYINPFTHSIAVKLLESGRIHAEELVSDHVGLDDLAAKLSHNAPKTSGRVLVHPALRGS
jgi:L-iditol 2-dehydrogenase